VLSRFFARLAISLAVILIALIASVIAVIYFAYALFLFLSTFFVPAAAAVLSGLLVLLAALLLIVALRAASRSGRRRRTREPIPSVDVWENAAELGTELGRKIRNLSEAHASGGLMAALVAGFAIGLSPKLRAFLQALLKP
jgi:uncharacterized membrane protein YbhN (UPF0104 family)